MKYVILPILFLLFFTTSLNFDNHYNYDKFETINRRIYSFNRGLDKVFVNPFSDIYLNVVPEIIACSINNFFKNISEIQNLFLNLLIKNYNETYINISRFLINSSIGVFGFFDFAERCNLFYNLVDIRTFLGVYGFDNSNYIILPFIGPSTLNFCTCFIMIQFLNPCFYFFNKLFIYYFFEIINKKSYINFDVNFFHKNMFDGYLFLKDAYIQNSEVFYKYKTLSFGENIY